MRAFQEIGISLDDLLEKIGDLIQVVEADGTLVYVNDRWLNVLGYTLAEAEALNFEDLLHPAYRALFERLREQLWQGVNFTSVEFVLRSRHGQDVVVEGSLIPRMAGEHCEAVIGVLRDVTSRKQVATELDHLFHLSVDMLGILSLDGSFLKTNPAFQATLGYSPDHLHGRRLTDFVHPDDLAATLGELERLRRGETSISFENRYRARDGSYKWLAWSSTPYRDEGQIYFVARDNTERRLAEEQVFHAKEQLQAILDNSAALIYVKTYSGEYLLVNQRFADLFHIDKLAIQGKTDYELFPSGVAAPLRQDDLQVLQSGRAMEFEEVVPHEDGLHTYLSTKFPLRDADGAIYAVCGISTDITSRKMTELQLLIRNKAIEASPSGITIADMSLPDQPLIYVNRAFEENTGYHFGETIGRNCRFLQGDDRDQPALDEVRDAIREGRDCTVVLRNYHKSGRMFWNELRLAPIFDEAGRLTHYVGISTDITRRIETNEQLQRQNEALKRANAELGQARQQAEEATRLKSQFLATMSHELRTPLNAIIGYTEIQLAGMAGELNAEQRDYQDRVLSNADHLLQLINDILDLSKIEAGRMQIVYKTFDVARWLQDIEMQTRGLAEEKGLGFHVAIDERLPQILVGDAARIRQVLINLISNAVKFTNAGEVRINVHKHGHDAWKIAVTDTGIGIPSHMQETIFEEFRQIDSTSQRKQGGTGLGLSIVRKLTLMMGGNIRLQSQPGQGSTFTIILPLQQSHQTAEDPALPQR